MRNELNVEGFVVLKQQYDELRAAENRDYDKFSLIERDLVACAHYLARQDKNVEASFWLCDQYAYGFIKTGLLIEQYEEYLLNAVEQKHLDSMCMLGEYYCGLITIPALGRFNSKKGRELLERAEAAGHQGARYSLAYVLLSQPNTQSEDVKRAESLLKDLMDASYLKAFYLYYVRFCYEEDGLYYSDPVKGYNILVRAVSSIGSKQTISHRNFYAAKIYYYLGLCFQAGSGCERDDNQAVYHMRRSVKLHNESHAYYWLKNLGISVEEPSKISDGEEVSMDSERDETNDSLEGAPIEYDVIPFEEQDPDSVPDIFKEATRGPLTKGDLEIMLEPLSSLAGMEHMKDQIRDIFYTVMVEKLKESKGIEVQHKPMLHMVFSGNPGTGKTTVARLLGKMFKKMNLLTSGHVIEVDRSQMIGAYIGQSEERTGKLFELAHGGVLFIDEAYDLDSKDSTKDYGQHVIAMLTKEMEDKREDFIVIMAGYKEEMNWLMKNYTGLSSRIGFTLDFPDYTDEEKVHIFEMFATKAAMKVNKKAKEKLAYIFENMELNEKDNFGNGRGVRSLFEETLRHQARRIITNDITHKTKLMTITASDIPGDFKILSKAKIVKLSDY